MVFYHGNSLQALLNVLLTCRYGVVPRALVEAVRLLLLLL